MELSQTVVNHTDGTDVANYEPLEHNRQAIISPEDGKEMANYKSSVDSKGRKLSVLKMEDRQNGTDVANTQIV